MSLLWMEKYRWSNPPKSPRCSLCYWALYDGDWCQNPTCKRYSKSVNKNRVYLTNEEAIKLIQKKEGK
jgi:hypothetical protein